MQEIVIQTYDIKELDKEVQQKVLDKHRDIDTDFYTGFLEDNFKEELKEYGIEVKSFGWDVYRNRHFYMNKPCVVDIRLLLTKLGLDKHEMAMKFDDCRVSHISLSGPRNRDSNCAELEIEYSEEVECSEERMTAINELQNDMENSINLWLDDMNNKFLKEIEAEYDYRSSDEAIIDTLEANDYKFTKDGINVRY